jgi:hypothetical protein
MTRVEKWVVPELRLVQRRAQQAGDALSRPCRVLLRPQ